MVCFDRDEDDESEEMLGETQARLLWQGIKVINSRKLQISLAPDWQFSKSRKRIVTIKDVVKYFKTQAGSRRSLAGIDGDWRMIDYIAQDCLNLFKKINCKGLRKESLRQGLEPVRLFCE